jgi:hypothetical protein
MIFRGKFFQHDKNEVEIRTGSTKKGDNAGNPCKKKRVKSLWQKGNLCYP